MLVERDITDTVLRFAKFPVVGLFGPRQSGKTFLAKHIFNKHTYFNLEDPALREFVKNDPKKFLHDNIKNNNNGIILDEFQYVPEILSYIQVESDANERSGYYILTGSQNFLMNEAVTQSLAGRIGILTLLPFSIHELQNNNLLTDNVNELIFKGGYPKIYSNEILPNDLYPSYINSYLERDVRKIINVENLSTFQRFMKLCAGRIGQLLNITDIAMNCGIDQKTAKHWLSLLEASYIIYLLQPYYENFNKRIIKTPKLYFYDTGLACALLGIDSAKELSVSNFRGPLFECFIISDFYKQYYNMRTNAPLYFWRDKNGYIEVDCLVKLGMKLIPVEIKSGETIVSDFFDSIKKWNEMTQDDPSNSYIVYGGQLSQSRSVGNVVNWQKAGNLIDKLEKTRI